MSPALAYGQSEMQTPKQYNINTVTILLSEKEKKVTEHAPMKSGGQFLEAVLWGCHVELFKGFHRLYSSKNHSLGKSAPQDKIPFVKYVWHCANTGKAPTHIYHHQLKSLHFITPLMHRERVKFYCATVNSKEEAQQYCKYVFFTYYYNIKKYKLK